MKPYTREELDVIGPDTERAVEALGSGTGTVPVPGTRLLRLLATARAGLADSERLDFLLRGACVTTVEDGDQLALFLRGDEELPAIAIVADITGDDGEITEDDASWLTEAQRANLSGTVPDATGYDGTPTVLRAAIDAASRREQPNTFPNKDPND